MYASTSSAAPVTPVRTTFADLNAFAPSGNDDRRRPLNPRKRRLPDSPVKPAFPTSPRRRSAGLALHTLATTSSSPFASLQPAAPLLPPAPVFEVLPLPPLSPDSPSPRSSPMKRSPAMRDLAAFTRAAYCGDDDDAHWEAGSVSRFELGAAKRADVWRGWTPVPTAAVAKPEGDDAQLDDELAFPPFHMELPPSAASSSSSSSTGLGLGLGFHTFGDDALPLASTAQSPFALSPSPYASSPAPASPTPSYASSSATPSLCSSSYSSSSSSLASLQHTSRSTSPSLPFAHLSLSPAPSLSGEASPVLSPSSLAMRRLHSREKRREASQGALLGLGLVL
ncbi:hypothetical protein JCM10450v2_003967 [Rhodotorula kratochvilovae]